MDSNLNEKLVGVFREVIEHLAFMFADPVEKEEVAGLAERALCVRMEFSGPLSGWLLLAAPREAGSEIAANILGVDSDDSAALTGAEDALKEVLNVTCGRLLTALAGEGPVFHLTVPQSVPVDGAEWARLLAADETQAFEADGNTVLLSVSANAEG